MHFVRIIRAFVIITCVSYASSSFADFFSGASALQKKDYATAFLEFSALAKKGDASAQAMLGLLYYEGLGAPQDYRMAAVWYEKSANQGDFDAQFRLGKMLINGVGVDKNPQRAAVLMEKSANQRLLFAMYYIGMMYKSGDGVPIDNIQAHKWLNLAASYSDSELTSEYIKRSKAARSDLEAIMSAEQIRSAQNLATEWHLEKEKRNEVLLKEWNSLKK